MKSVLTVETTWVTTPQQKQVQVPVPVEPDTSSTGDQP